MSDEQRSAIMAAYAASIKRLVRMAVACQIPKHVILDLISEAYDKERDNARMPQ
jgi:hypothetical protein